jgi:periplasmic protein TonB
LESPLPPEAPLPELPEDSSNAVGRVYRLTPGSGIVSPKIIYQIDPEFTEEARKGKEQGRVVVNLVVGTDGSPQNPRLRCGAPAGLNEKALNAVKQWRFNPSTKDGKPVPVEIDVEVEFRQY